MTKILSVMDLNFPLLLCAPSEKYIDSEIVFIRELSTVCVNESVRDNSCDSCRNLDTIRDCTEENVNESETSLSRFTDRE